MKHVITNLFRVTRSAVVGERARQLIRFQILQWASTALVAVDCVAQKEQAKARWSSAAPGDGTLTVTSTTTGSRTRNLKLET
ncbi:jg3668 [Pararge aegeria aegeria]|uniref:Jg3668 protein n=1 Tax=Pararge aegeria aegeria TaxID=348720 RepID=A0A8S4S9V8_9NEOP|nr:jg3668 [Pararge aegeria aegeria]